MIQPANPAACTCEWANHHRQWAEAAEARYQCLARNTPKKPRKSPIPPLKPNRIPQYIAAIARTVATGGITASQGNGMLYAAQILISLMRASQPPPPPPNVLGFKPPKKGSKK